MSTNRPPTEPEAVEAPTLLRVTRSGVLGSLAVIVVAFVCVRLGIWQLHRLQQRKVVNAAVSERMNAEPATLGRVPADTVGLLFRRIRVTGELDTDRSLVVAGRSFEGAPGVHLVTPIKIPGGAILVNRGWLPSPDAATVDLRRYAKRGTVTLVGLALPLGSDEDAADYAGRADSAGFRRVWYGYEAAMRAQLPYRTAAFYLQELPDRPADPRAVGPETLPARLPPPVLSEGPHLSYAIQWFSFAIIALVGWTLLALRGGAIQVRGPRPPPEAESGPR